VQFLHDVSPDVSSDVSLESARKQAVGNRADLKHTPSPGKYLVRSGSIYLFQMRMPQDIGGTPARILRIGLGPMTAHQAKARAELLASLARECFEQMRMRRNAASQAILRSSIPSSRRSNGTPCNGVQWPYCVELGQDRKPCVTSPTPINGTEEDRTSAPLDEYHFPKKSTADPQLNINVPVVSELPATLFQTRRSCGRACRHTQVWVDTRRRQCRSE